MATVIYDFDWDPGKAQSNQLRGQEQTFGLDGGEALVIALHDGIFREGVGLNV